MSVAILPSWAAEALREAEANKASFAAQYAGVKVIQLAYSGGKASHCLLEMVLRGDLIPPAPLVVTCADPGMEDVRTYEITRAAEARCRAAGIPFLRTGRNLYKEILAAKQSGATRFDFPAFFTKNRETGKIGRLMQKCTKWCKIAPMDRAMRHWMDAHLGISKISKRLGEKILCKWIGFSFNEHSRIKDYPHPKYFFLDYPLVNLGITDEKILGYYFKHGIPVPPRSVCSACFANDNLYFKEMFETRPENWAQAVKIDEEIRDLSQFGVRDECFVYAGCVPLTQLAEQRFPKLGKTEPHCHTGHCFI